MPKKKLHPADAANEAIIADPEGFKVSLFLGRGRYENRDATSLAEAESIVAALKAEHPATTRLPIIYALKGRSMAPISNTKPPAKKTKAKAPKARKRSRVEIEAAACAGKLPAAPDFSAPTHARFRNKLAAITAMVKAEDLRGLRSIEINPFSSSPKALDRYRNLAVMALEARRTAA